MQLIVGLKFDHVAAMPFLTLGKLFVQCAPPLTCSLIRYQSKTEKLISKLCIRVRDMVHCPYRWQHELTVRVTLHSTSSPLAQDHPEGDETTSVAADCRLLLASCFALSDTNLLILFDHSYLLSAVHPIAHVRDCITTNFPPKINNTDECNFMYHVLYKDCF